MTINDAPPIACTLAPRAYKDRLGWIAALNKDALLHHERHDLVLDLRYAAQARDHVREMVRNEQACCGFLAFDLRETGDETRLTITAPETARDAADILFEQFATDTPAFPRLRLRLARGELRFAKAAWRESSRCCRRDDRRWRGRMRRMLRPSVRAAGGRAGGQRRNPRVVRRHAWVGQRARGPCGRRRVGLDRQADAPLTMQTGGINTLGHGNSDGSNGRRPALAMDRTAARAPLHTLTADRFDLVS